MKNNYIKEYKSIKNFVKKERVLSINSIKNKKQLFNEIEILLKTETVFTGDHLSKILFKTENLNPTNLGNGVAIPNMQNNKIKRVSGCFIRLKKSITYDSLKNNPVDLIFALFSPEEFLQNHLRMLARVSRLLKNFDIPNKLRGAINDEALFEILVQAELK